MEEVKVGEVWSGRDEGLFDIVRVEPDLKNPPEIWVHYRSRNTRRQHSCWMGNFLTRFSKAEE